MGLLAQVRDRTPQVRPLSSWEHIHIDSCCGYVVFPWQRRAAHTIGQSGSRWWALQALQRIHGHINTS
jgi:hypothetical protein